MTRDELTTCLQSILTEVDSRVAEKEKEDRKLEIYHKIDAKSFTMYRGNKFKKSDILSNNRKLRYDGVFSSPVELNYFFFVESSEFSSYMQQSGKFALVGFTIEPMTFILDSKDRLV